MHDADDTPPQIPDAESDEAPDPVEVPHTDIAPDVLRGVIESFVLREGTEYGATDHSLEQKVAQVMRQLERGTARIMFEPESATVTIVTKNGRGAA